MGTSWFRVASKIVSERRVHPLAGAVGTDLLLPDGHVRLDSVDRRAARRESVIAVRRGREDRDRGLSDLEASDSVLDPHANVRPVAGKPVRDPRQLGLRHRAVGLVVDGHRFAAAAFVAHDADENADRSIRETRFLQERRQVDRLGGQVLFHQPPATGGRKATSSPSWSSVSAEAYSRLTAAGGMAPNLAK